MFKGKLRMYVYVLILNLFLKNWCFFCILNLGWLYFLSLSFKEFFFDFIWNKIVSGKCDESLIVFYLVWCNLNYIFVFLFLENIVIWCVWFWNFKFVMDVIF